MPPWFTDSGTAAWVQAVGSILAILIAVWVPYSQRRNALHDAQNDRTQHQKEFLQRLAAALRAEIGAALDAADRLKSTVENVIRHLQVARKRGESVASNGSLRPGSIVLTDAIVYRQIASDVGRLPPELIKSVVEFYAYAGEFGRIVDASPIIEDAFKIVHELTPRLKIRAALLIKMLDKFEAFNFEMTADIHPTLDDVKAIAAEVGYPLDEVAKERGVHL